MSYKVPYPSGTRCTNKRSDKKRTFQKYLFICVGGLLVLSLGTTNATAANKENRERVYPAEASSVTLTETLQTTEIPEAKQIKPTLRRLLESVPERLTQPSTSTTPAPVTPVESIPVEPGSSQGAESENSASEASQTVRLLLKLGERKVYVYRGDSVEAVYPVAVGRAGWETPTGEFTVLHQVVDPGWTNPLTGEEMPPGPDNPLGDRWIMFWTDNVNAIGFHGTPNRESVGTAASHGCIRMYNEDVRELYEIVSVGTPVIVEP